MGFYRWLARLLPDPLLPHIGAIKVGGLVIFVLGGFVARAVTTGGIVTVLWLVVAVLGATIFGAATLAGTDLRQQ